MEPPEFNAPERSASLPLGETPVLLACESDVYAFITDLSNKYSPMEVDKALSYLDGNGKVSSGSPASNDLIEGLEQLAGKYGEDKVLAAAKGYVGVVRNNPSGE